MGDAIAELRQINGMAYSATEVLGKETDIREGAHRAYGPTGDAAWHGTDVKQAAGERDREHFFRAVDQAVVQHHSKPSGLPLILAALPEHHGLFQSVSNNPLLMPETIPVHPDALSLDALRERAWQILQPHYLNRLAGLVDAYGAAAASDKGSDALSDVAKAAVDGRVATLLIEADRLIPGNINAADGALTLGQLDDPTVDDLLDDLGELVLRKGGEVVIVPAERMPTTTGAAAVYRY